jgi:hypothetical protein
VLRAALPVGAIITCRGAPDRGGAGQDNRLRGHLVRTLIVGMVFGVFLLGLPRADHDRWSWWCGWTPAQPTVLPSSLWIRWERGGIPRGRQLGFALACCAHGGGVDEPLSGSGAVSSAPTQMTGARGDVRSTALDGGGLLTPMVADLASMITLSLPNAFAGGGWLGRKRLLALPCCWWLPAYWVGSCERPCQLKGRSG